VIYSFVFLKICGQDRSVYFLAVLSADWLRGVDARPSRPPRRDSPKAGGDSSTDVDGEDEDAWMPYVHEKLWGKQPAGEEPSLKRRKMDASSHQEGRPVTIGAFAQPQRQQVVMSSSSNDDEQAAPPSPRVMMPSPSALARAET